MPTESNVQPRGTYDTLWDQSPRKQVQHRRRFYLLGQTWEGQQVYDVCRAVRALRTVPELKDDKIIVSGDGPMAAVVLYAAILEPGIDAVELRGLPASHMPATAGSEFAPPLLNVLRYLDVPQAVALAAERIPVTINSDNAETWRYAAEVAKTLGWKDRVIHYESSKPVEKDRKELKQ